MDWSECHGFRGDFMSGQHEWPQSPSEDQPRLWQDLGQKQHHEMDETEYDNNSGVDATMNG